MNKTERSAKRKSLRPWKGLTIWYILFALNFSLFTPMLHILDNDFMLVMPGSTWKMKDADPSAIYYPLSFADDAEAGLQSAGCGCIWPCCGDHQCHQSSLLDFEQYENDPYIRTLMRDACHYGLYALANSAAMNGIGPNTEISKTIFWPVKLSFALAIIFWGLAAFCAVRWHRRRKAWKVKK